MKHFLTAIVSLLLAVAAYSQVITYNGIYYQVLPNQKDVTVISAQNGEAYSGKITIPASFSVEENTYTVTHIGKMAFFNSAITSISLPEGLLEIGIGSFKQCYELKAVTIPSSVITIREEAFLFAFNLATLTFKAKTRPYIGNYAFGKTKVILQGIDTSIPSNMAVPSDERFSVDKERGIITY